MCMDNLKTISQDAAKLQRRSRRNGVAKWLISCCGLVAITTVLIGCDDDEEGNEEPPPPTTVPAAPPATTVPVDGCADLKRYDTSCEAARRRGLGETDVFDNIETGHGREETSGREVADAARHLRIPNHDTDDLTEIFDQFDAKRPMTRGDVIEGFCTAAGGANCGSPEYALQTMVDAGITNLQTDDPNLSLLEQFGSDNPLTNLQLVTMMNRLQDYAYSIHGSEPPRSSSGSGGYRLVTLNNNSVVVGYQPPPPPPPPFCTGLTHSHGFPYDLHEDGSPMGNCHPHAEPDCAVDGAYLNLSHTWRPVEYCDPLVVTGPAVAVRASTPWDYEGGNVIFTVFFSEPNTEFAQWAWNVDGSGASPATRIDDFTTELDEFVGQSGRLSGATHVNYWVDFETDGLAGECDEYVTFEIVPERGLVAGDTLSAEVLIVDVDTPDDVCHPPPPPLEVSFADTDLTVIEGSAVTVTVTSDAASIGTAYVGFTSTGATRSTSDCPDTPSPDAFSLSAQVFELTDTDAATVTFTACEDLNLDDETIVVSLMSAPGLIIGTPDTLTVTVLDNDICRSGQIFDPVHPEADISGCRSVGILN